MEYIEILGNFFKKSTIASITIREDYPEKKHSLFSKEEEKPKPIGWLYEVTQTIVGKHIVHTLGRVPREEFKRQQNLLRDSLDLVQFDYNEPEEAKELEEPPKFAYPNKMFLGGTCNESPWRESFIPILEELGIAYFNPVVEDWTDECKEIEEKEKQICDWHIYVITPLQTGMFAVAELVERVINHPHTTLVCFHNLDHKDNNRKTWSSAKAKSIESVKSLVSKYTDNVFDHMFDAATFLKQQEEKYGR